MWFWRCRVVFFDISWYFTISNLGFHEWHQELSKCLWIPNFFKKILCFKCLCVNLKCLYLAIFYHRIHARTRIPMQYSKVGMSEKLFSRTKSTSALHAMTELNLLCMNPFEFRESVQKRVSCQRMKTAVSGRNFESNSIDSINSWDTWRHQRELSDHVPDNARFEFRRYFGE